MADTGLSTEREYFRHSRSFKPQSFNRKKWITNGTWVYHPLWLKHPHNLLSDSPISTPSGSVIYEFRSYYPALLSVAERMWVFGLLHQRYIKPFFQDGFTVILVERGEGLETKSIKTSYVRNSRIWHKGPVFFDLLISHLRQGPRM